MVYFILWGMLMYQLIYNLGLKIYHNMYGKTVLKMIVFLTISIIMKDFALYSFSSSGYSILTDNVIQLFKIFGFIVKPSPTFEIFWIFFPISIIFVMLFLNFKGLFNKNLFVRFLPDDDNVKIGIKDLELDIVVPKELFRYSVMFSLFYMLTIELSLINWYFFKNVFSMTFQNSIIILGLFSLYSFVLLSIEMQTFLQKQYIENIFLLDGQQLVTDIFEDYIKNGEKLISSENIDMNVRKFIEIGIFESAYNIDFSTINNSKYRINIEEKFLKLYIKSKNKNLGSRD